MNVYDILKSYEPVKVKNPIVGLFSDSEIETMALHYKNAVMGVNQGINHKALFSAQGDIADIVYRVAHIETAKMGVSVSYVDGQPYPDADTMRDDVIGNKQLRISRDFNADPVLLPFDNLLFRTAHDLHHCQSDRCNFNFWGECCACAKFLQYRGNHPLLTDFLVGEIVSQVAYLRVYGDYSEQVAYLAPNWIAQRIIGAYFRGE